MHSMGLHSALAIKRQRKRRDEQRRARERRYSQQSNESGLGESNSSFVSPRSSVRGRRRHQSSTAPDALVENKMMSSVGMLHIGVVFLVLGGFLLGSGLLPEDLTSWSQFTTSNWWNELTIAGGCAILLGVFLIVLNRYMARREEEDLTEYVQRQLTRSRSGHRLVRDVETGALTNKHSAAARSAAAAAAAGHGHGGHGGRTPSDPDVFASVTDSAVDSPLQSPAVRSPPHHHLHCDLEQILEEDGVSDRGGMMADLMAPSPGFSPAGGVSPGSGPDTPVETRELLHHHGSGHGHHGGGHGHHGSGHGPHGSGHGHHGSGHGPHGSGHGHHGSGHGPHGGGHGPHGDDPHGGHNFHSHHHQSHHMVAI